MENKLRAKILEHEEFSEKSGKLSEGFQYLYEAHVQKEPLSDVTGKYLGHFYVLELSLVLGRFITPILNQTIWYVAINIKQCLTNYLQTSLFKTYNCFIV